MANGVSTIQLVRSILKDDLIVANLWQDDFEEQLPTKFQMLTNVVLFPKDSLHSMEFYWTHLPAVAQMWEKVLGVLKCTGVARKGKTKDNEFRSPGCMPIYGTTMADIMQFKVRYQFDVTKCMFSLGNVTEKERISSWDLRGKVVADLYAGIGYFTLPFLVNSKADYVFAYEWNEAAYRQLLENLKLNNVASRCYTFFGDNKQNVVDGVADVVNLGLLPSAADGYGAAIQALQCDGGLLIVHGNCTKESIYAEDDDTKDGPYKVDNAFSSFSSLPMAWRIWAKEVATAVYMAADDLLGESRRASVTIVGIKKVKKYGPKIDHMVVDLKVYTINKQERAARENDMAMVIDKKIAENGYLKE